MHNIWVGWFRTNPRGRGVVRATMNIGRLAVLLGGITFGAGAGAALQFSSVSAAVPSIGHALAADSAPVTPPTPRPAPRSSRAPMTPALALTNNVKDPSVLRLHL